MPSRAATYSDVTAFNARAYDARDYRRSIFGSAVLGLGGVSAAAVMAGTVAVAAAWMVSGSLARNPEFRASAPFALETAVLPPPPRRLADPADMFGGALASANPAYATGDIPQQQLASDASAPAVALPTITSQLPPQQTAALVKVPLPPPRPRILARVHVKPEMAPAPVLSAAPMTTESHVVQAETPPVRLAQKPLGIGEQKEIAALAFGASLSPETTGSIGAIQSGPARVAAKPILPRLAYNNPDTPPLRDSRTAIYDIVAHTVYMPDGERLEAHSGLGRMLDDPRYISQKGRGPTPPNTYDLTLRSGMFHGVQALRLNPAADSKMYGRDGILAHTYMLGPSGQSFGCVSFKNYSEFLRAFQHGEVNRLVVVPHLQSPPPGVRADRDDGEHYAFDLESVH
jgi:hypothetical protein